MKITNKICILQQAVSLASNFPSTLGWMFRGQTDWDWSLLPAAGRPPHFISDRPINPNLKGSSNNPPPDLGRFKHWSDLAEGILDNLPSNPFRRLALAQHYGLPTRLLDFSENILIALYFACEETYEKDGALYAYFPYFYLDIDQTDFFNVPEVACLDIPPFDSRILSQRGKLVYFPNPAAPLTPNLIAEEYSLDIIEQTQESLVLKFKIPADSKLAIYRQLTNIGVSRRSLFPDLEGLSRDFVVEDRYNFAFNKRMLRK